MSRYDGSPLYTDEFEWALAVDAIEKFLSTRPRTREAMEELHKKYRETKYGTPENERIESTIEQVGERIAAIAEDNASMFDFRYMVAATMMGFDF